MSRLMPLLTLSSLVLIGAGCEVTSSSEAPTYYTDVRPIVESHCTRCHFDGGGGTGDFADPETVLALGEVMNAAVQSGRMPPPVADPTCLDYEHSDRLVLPEEDRATLQAWVDGGKQRGDPAASVEGDSWETELADPDVIFMMEHPYTPTFSDPDNPGNEYRCFVLENTQEETFYVTALSPVVDRPEIVHHIVVWLQSEDESLPGYDPETGADCIDNVGANSERMLAGWAPGMMPVEFPEGRGIAVAPNQNLVVQMHYYDNGQYDGGSDQSGYAVRTADSVEQPLLMVPLGTQSFSIPAGDEAYTHTESLQMPPQVSGMVYASFPHMHVLGSGYNFTATDDTGTERCLVRSDRYDFDNQLTYVFKEPLPIRGGDTVSMSCTWNNSTSNPDLIHDPPIEVGYGERTDEEMCFAFSLISIGE